MVTHPAAVSDTPIVSGNASGPLLPRGAAAPAPADILDQDDDLPTQNQQPTYLDQDLVTKMKPQRFEQNMKSALGFKSLRLVHQVGMAAPSGPPPNQGRRRPAPSGPSRRQ